ncbi:MAG: 6-phosphogluconolactonase [Rhizobacter sp.]
MLTSAPNEPELLVFENPLQAAQALAHDLVAQLSAALDRQGAATFAVSGGRSPGLLFDELSRSRLDWPGVMLSLVDERWVDPGAGDSNERFVRERLLTRHAAGANFVPLKTRADHPAEAVADRNHALQPMLAGADAIVLGMGEDGHIASLFPRAPGLAAALDPTAAASLVAIEPPTAPHARLGMNLAALLGAAHLTLLVSGHGKAALLSREAREARRDAPLPIDHLLRHRRQPLRMYWSP